MLYNYANPRLFNSDEFDAIFFFNYFNIFGIFQFTSISDEFEFPLNCLFCGLARFMFCLDCVRNRGDLLEANVIAYQFFEFEFLLRN